MASAPEWMLNLVPAGQPPPARVDSPLWSAFDKLGLLDKYESLVSSVCYEYIESYILETCAKRWDEPMLTVIREWMADNIVPWMIMPYARGARNGTRRVVCPDTPIPGYWWTLVSLAEEARSMLQGVGSRLDFHVCKTLTDLRWVTSKLLAFALKILYCQDFRNLWHHCGLSRFIRSSAWFEG